MSTRQSNLVVTIAFLDETTRKYTLPDIDSDDETIEDTAPEIAKAINAGTATNVADFKRTFVSNGGASAASIQGVSFVTITEEDIYNVKS